MRVYRCENEREREREREIDREKKGERRERRREKKGDKPLYNLIIEINKNNFIVGKKNVKIIKIFPKTYSMNHTKLSSYNLSLLRFIYLSLGYTLSKYMGFNYHLCDFLTLHCTVYTVTQHYIVPIVIAFF